MIKYKKLQDREWLAKELETKSMHRIAHENGCSYSAIVYAKSIFGIEPSGVYTKRENLRNTLDKKLALCKDEIIGLYTSGGMTLPDIAKKYGVEYFGLRKMLRIKWRVDTSLGKPILKRRILEPYKEQIINDYSNGKNVEDIVNQYGCSYKTASSTLKKWGIKIRGIQSQNPKLQDKEWLRNEYLENKQSIKKIAKAINASEGAVYSALKYAGVDFRSVSNGILVGGSRSGKNSSNWKGGVIKRKNQYIHILSPDHPNRDSRGYVQEHRLVVEKTLGRYLTPKEAVHHKDGNKHNNKPENLELISSKGQHTRQHFEDSHKVASLEARIKELEEENAKLTPKEVVHHKSGAIDA